MLLNVDIVENGFKETFQVKQAKVCSEWFEYSKDTLIDFIEEFKIKYGN